MKEVMGPSDRADGIIAYGEEVQKTVADKLAEIPEEEYPNTLILSNYNESAILRAAPASRTTGSPLPAVKPRL